MYVKSVQKKVHSHHLDMSSTITISRNLIYLFGAKVMPKVYCSEDNWHTHSAGRVLQYEECKLGKSQTKTKV